MFWNYIFDENISLCRCRHRHKCSRLDLIRNDRILRSSQLLNTTDTDDIRSGALDICTHTVQEVRYIYNVWLLRSILDRRLSLCKHGCHHDIDGCTNRYHIEINMISNQLVCFRNNLTAIYNLYFRTKCLKALDMLVDRTQSNITAARQSNLCIVVFTKQSSKQIVGCSYLPNIFIIHTDILAGSDCSAADRNCMVINVFYLSANCLDCTK